MMVAASAKAPPQVRIGQETVSGVGMDLSVSAEPSSSSSTAWSRSLTAAPPQGGSGTTESASARKHYSSALGDPARQRSGEGFDRGAYHAENLPRCREPAAALDVVSFLHTAGERYRQHRELLRKQRDIEERKSLTFKPEITQVAVALYNESKYRQSSSVENRLHVLHAKQQAREEAARAQKEEAEKEAVERAMRPPKITRLAASLGHRDPIVTTKRWLKAREDNLERLREEAVRKEMRRLRDMPEVSVLANAPEIARRRGGRSIGDYLLAQQEVRRKRMYALAEQSAMRGLETTGTGSLGFPARRRVASQVPVESLTPQCGVQRCLEDDQSFTPHITEYAQKLPLKGSVVERLYVANPSSLRCSYDEELETECTFRPLLAPRSVQLAKQMDEIFKYCPVEESSAVEGSRIDFVASEAAARNAGHGPTVHSRLYAQATRNTRGSMGTSGHSCLGGAVGDSGHRDVADEEFTGVPRICEGSRLIIERKRQLSQEHHASPASRLHVPAAADKASNGMSLRVTGASTDVASCDEELTFHPRINKKSEELWRQRIESTHFGIPRGEPGYHVASNEAREAYWKQAHNRKEAQLARWREEEAFRELEECTFAPKAGRPPERQSALANLPQHERLELWQHQKERRLRAMREELERQVDEACTFRPSVEDEYPLPQRRHRNAKGVSQHLHRQELARRRREEEENWWRPRVGDGFASRSVKSGVTVPSGFHLMTEERGTGRSSQRQRSHERGTPRTSNYRDSADDERSTNRPCANERQSWSHSERRRSYDARAHGERGSIVEEWPSEGARRHYQHGGLGPEEPCRNYKSTSGGGSYPGTNASESGEDATKDKLCDSYLGTPRSRRFVVQQPPAHRDPEASRYLAQLDFGSKGKQLQLQSGRRSGLSNASSHTTSPRPHEVSVGPRAHSTEPSPVDFIIHHHEAMLRAMRSDRQK